MLLKPLWIDGLVVKQSLFELCLDIDQHVGSGAGDRSPIVDFEFPGIKLDNVNFATKVVVEHLQPGCRTDLLVIKAVPLVVDVDEGIVVARFCLDALVHQDGVELILAPVIRHHLPFREINYVGIFEVVHYLLVLARVVVELEPLQLHHQDGRQTQKPDAYITSLVTFFRHLGTIEFGLVEIVSAENLLGYVVIEGLLERFGETEGDIEERLDILGTKISVKDVHYPLGCTQLGCATCPRTFRSCSCAWGRGRPPAACAPGRRRRGS